MNTKLPVDIYVPRALATYDVVAVEQALYAAIVRI